MLSRFVQPGMIVADIGCGTGFYTLELAKLVGESGLVTAVDFQSKMLEITGKRAGKTALGGRIKLVHCTREDLSLSEKFDFILTMWVAHEVGDRKRFFRQIREALRPAGRHLLAEPKFHVNKQLYNEICRDAQAAGLVKIDEPKVGISYAALFEPELGGR